WLTYRLFTEAPRVVRHYRRIYRYILIDEAQDTSRAQYEILKALCGDEHRNVMMVADADQSIYRFAGASDRYIQLFQKDFGAKLMPLRHNFRSTPEIVQIANKLIQHSTRLPGAPMMVSNVTGKNSEVILHEEETQEQEARWVAERVLKLENQLRDEQKTKTGKDEPQFSEIAILARNRYLLEPVQVALKAQAIPYRFHTANEGLFATSQAQIFYLILRVLHNPFDLIHREILLTDLGISSHNFDATFDGVNENTASAFFRIIAKKQEIPSCWRDFIKILLVEVNNAAKISEYYANLLAAFEQQVFPCETDAEHDELLQRDLQLLKDQFQAFSHKHSREELDLEGFLG
ncbi:ATP-dependent helicase, partial [bacterium]|nr:ATP-dependent helicase [bacterium]